MEKRGKLTKKDYMCLPKERLAELLVELQEAEPEIEFVPNTTPTITPRFPWNRPYGPIVYMSNPNQPDC